MLNFRFSGAALVVITCFVGPMVEAQNPGGDVRLLEMMEREVKARVPEAALMGGRPYMTQLRQGETRTIEFGFGRGVFATVAMCEVQLCRDLRLELFDSNGRRVPLRDSQVMREGQRTSTELRVLFPWLEYSLAGSTDMRLRVTLGLCSLNPCWVLIASYELPSDARSTATPRPAMTLTGARLTVAPTLVLERLVAVASPQSVPTRFFKALGLRPAAEQMSGRARYVVAGLAFEFAEALDGAIVVSRSIGSETQWFLTDRGGGLRAAMFETSGTLDGPYTSVSREAADAAFRETLASWDNLLSQR